MSNNEPVSVIVTCFNLEKYIGDSIGSVSSQDYDGDVQLIVVDDCSTDSSRLVISEFAGIDCVALQQNGGVMQAMIAGLRVAKYDVVFFLDGDDIWHQKKISSCMKKMGKGTKLVTHDLWYMDSVGANLGRSTIVSKVLSSISESENNEMIFRCVLGHSDYVWLGSAFGVRRSIGQVDDFINFCRTFRSLEFCYQDWPLAVWVASRAGGDMSYVDSKLFGYRLHSNNYSGSTQTLEKLQRNLYKAKCTMQLIVQILIGSGAEQIYVDKNTNLMMKYALLHSTTLGSRTAVLLSLKENYPGISFDVEGLKLLLRLLLSLTLGSWFSHRVLEWYKRKGA